MVVMGKNEIVLFESRDGAVSLPVSVIADTIWLSQLQMAQLFGKDKTVIFRHVKNAIADGEIDPKVTSAKFAQVTPHGAIVGKRVFSVAARCSWWRRGESLTPLAHARAITPQCCGHQGIL